MTFRLCLLALALAATARAQTDEAAVLVQTTDGLRLRAVTDAAADGRSALVGRVDGGWRLRVLSDDETPSEAPDDFLADRLFGTAASALPDGPRIVRLSDEIESELAGPEAVVERVGPRVERVMPPDERVTYRVRGHAEAGDDAALVRLAEAEGLRSLEARSMPDRTVVELEFQFDSAAAWAEWQAAPTTQALLGALRDADTTLRVQRR